MGTFIEAVGIFFDLLEILIIARVFMNIFRISFSNLVGSMIYQLTEPIIAPARLILEKVGLNRLMIDFSPWVAILLLRLVHSGLLRIVASI